MNILTKIYTGILSCGHSQEVKIGDKTVECHTCHALNRKMSTQEVMAIETREYHVKCQDCRFGRWTGQDISYARMARVQHRPDHHVVMDYMVPPKVKVVWKSVYGHSRRPKMIIVKTVKDISINV